MPSFDFITISNAIVDVLYKVDDCFLKSFNLSKGSTTFITKEQAEAFYKKLPLLMKCSGGSAANTAVGISSLGGRSAFVGCVADDLFGAYFKHDLLEAGIQLITPSSNSRSFEATARCHVLITPDFERTMQTYLGISTSLFEKDVVSYAPLIQASRVLFLEGYLWYNEEMLKAALSAARIAKAHGQKIALSLSEPTCVKNNQEAFLAFVTNYADVVFGNEAEIKALFGALSIEEALRAAQSLQKIILITRGKKGAILLSPSLLEPHSITAYPAKVVDTTGAGDLFASGFLYGYCRGYDLKTCGLIASFVASEVISHLGARPKANLKSLLNVFLKASSYSAVKHPSLSL